MVLLVSLVCYDDVQQYCMARQQWECYVAPIGMSWVGTHVKLLQSWGQNARYMADAWQMRGRSMAWCGSMHGIVWQYAWHSVAVCMAWCGSMHGMVWQYLKGKAEQQERANVREAHKQACAEP